MIFGLANYEFAKLFPTKLSYYKIICKSDNVMYLYLLYFAWADQRVLPFYNYRTVVG